MPFQLQFINLNNNLIFELTSYAFITTSSFGSVTTIIGGSLIFVINKIYISLKKARGVIMLPCGSEMLPETKWKSVAIFSNAVFDPCGYLHSCRVIT